MVIVGHRSEIKLVNREDNPEQFYDVDKILQELACLALEEWFKTKDSKNPIGLMLDSKTSSKIEV